MFFIIVEFPLLSKKLSFNAYFMGVGHDVYDIQQNCMVIINKTFVHSIEQQTCLPIEKYNTAEWKVNSIQVDDHLSNECEVLFHFDFITPLIVSNQIVESNESCELLSSQRTIQVPEEFHPKISLSADSKRVAIKTTQNVNIEVVAQCEICALVTRETIYMTSSGKVRYLICNICSLVVTSKYVFAKSVMPYFMEYFSQLIFSCIWDCGAFHNVDNLMKHEMNCYKKNKPNNDCPVSTCSFNGLFDHLTEHLAETHDVNIFSRFVLLDNKTHLESNYQC